MRREDTPLSRRAVLRGLGTALALPFLEALAPAARAAAAAGAARAAPPLRMAFLFVPNGVNVSHWAPAGEGCDYQLSSTLAPLVPFRDDVLVLTGLTHDKGRANGDGPGDHARSASVFLTGAQPVKTSGAGIRSGISVDQLAAQAIGSATRFPSLQLGCDGGGNSGNCDSGYSCAYSNNISWASPTTPVAKETDPRRVFDRLFAAGDREERGAARARRRERAQSILDFVLEDARRLRPRLGEGDRRKLDEYFTAVRELEGRLAAAEALRGTEVAEPEGIPAAPGERLPFEKHVRLMSDILVLAFQTDLTRIATFMYARAGSNRSYRRIGVPEGHHELSHHQGHPEKLRKIGEIDRFHVQQFAYLLGRLRSVEEESGTLLDSCMIVYGSGICDGNRHNNENLPIVLAGRGGGTIATGRHLRYPEETPLCNLYLSMLDRMGTEAERFGDSTGPLRYLTA